MGLRRFKGNMPVAGSCSVAIAAACHRPREDVDAAFLPVQWGEVVSVSRNDGEEVGHCCFTSLDVEPMVRGKMYAGAAMKEQREQAARQRRIDDV